MKLLLRYVWCFFFYDIFFLFLTFLPLFLFFVNSVITIVVSSAYTVNCRPAFRANKKIPHRKKNQSWARVIFFYMSLSHAILLTRHVSSFFKLVNKQMFRVINIQLSKLVLTPTRMHGRVEWFWKRLHIVCCAKLLLDPNSKISCINVASFLGRKAVENFDC